MYSMDDLLQLVSCERAEELRLHVGAPPIIVVKGHRHTVDGPAITAEDTEQLLQSVGGSKQTKDIRNRDLEFSYTFRSRYRFLVRARMEDEKVGLDIKRAYSIEDILDNVLSERATELKVHVGGPPTIVLEGGRKQLVDGPAITSEDADQLLRSIADSRQTRDIRKHGSAEFVYTFRGQWRFLVRASIEDGNVGLDIQRFL